MLKKRRGCGAKNISKSFEAKRLKAPHVRSTFGSCMAQKVHAAVARCTFRSQNVKSTSRSGRFWKLCCSKRDAFGSCVAQKAHADVARSTCQSQNEGLSTYFNAGALFASWVVEKVHAAVARSSAQGTKCCTCHVKSYKRTCRSDAPNSNLSEHFWKFRRRKSARRCGAKLISKTESKNITCSRHFWTLKRRFVWQAQGILHPAKSEQIVKVKNTQLQIQLQLRYITQHYATLITLHYATTTTATAAATTTSTTLHYVTLRYTTLHYVTLRYTTLHYVTLRYTTPHHTTLHCTTLHYTTLL